MNFARTLEAKHKFQNRKPVWPAGKTTSGGSSNPSPCCSSPPSHPKTPQAQQPTIKKLTGPEMEARKEQGLCFNCDEHYTRGHRCKKRFWVELEEEDEEEAPPVEEVATDEPEVSIHAITGLQTTSTMQLCVLVDAQPLVALVDLGSTHNFISLTAAKYLQLPVQSQPTASVSVANGDKVPSYGVSKSVRFAIAGHRFSADFYIIPLAGSDLVLGVKWLQTLGSILWDFTALTMSFDWQYLRVTLQGQATEGAAQLHSIQQQQPTIHTLDLLPEAFADLFLPPSSLPPLRHCDHIIHLKAGSKVMVVWPY
ncbi:uncharacterized protein [Aristolochia californica]|uniref:uncharacterized protein n=1 Tax=Aristolochia californica TaxID=171875 RepID=UPI0035D75B8E